MSRGWCRVELEWSGMRGDRWDRSVRIDAESELQEMAEDAGRGRAKHGGSYGGYGGLPYGQCLSLSMIKDG